MPSFFQLFFQVLLVYPWTTTHVYGRDLKLKMGVQIRNNTFCMQGAKGSIPFTSTINIKPDSAVSPTQSSLLRHFFQLISD